MHHLDTLKHNHFITIPHRTSEHPMKHKRIILGLFILLILITSMVYSYQNYEKNAPQLQRYTQIFENPDAYINTEISFNAEILEVDVRNNTVRVFIQERPYTYPQVSIIVEDLELRSLKKGDLIDVIGILNGKNQMTATQLWVNEPWKDMLIYLRSLPAIPFLLYLFIRTWTFNTTTWRFERRNKDA